MHEDVVVKTNFRDKTSVAQRDVNSEFTKE